MAKRKKSKFWIWLIVVAVLAVVCAFLTAYFHRKDKDKADEPAEFTVLETVIEWEDEAMTIDLLSGTIKTNKQADKIFVNVNGHGSQYLEFTSDRIKTDESIYFLHTISPQDCLLSTVFANDTTITIDVYVEYGGRSYKADVQNLAVSGCWIGNY